MTPESLENHWQEHIALMDHIKRLLEKSKNNSREFAKRTADQIQEQVQKLTSLTRSQRERNEERQMSRTIRNQEF
jgi:hypothetical protein